MAGFRVTCPSCEEPVRIKDESFIGKKVDCPTCKYRFVVEAPPETAAAEAPAKAGASKSAPAPRRDTKALPPASNKNGAAAGEAGKKPAAAGVKRDAAANGAGKMNGPTKGNGAIRAGAPKSAARARALAADGEGGAEDKIKARGKAEKRAALDSGDEPAEDRQDEYPDESSAEAEGSAEGDGGGKSKKKKKKKKKAGKGFGLAVVKNFIGQMKDDRKKLLLYVGVAGIGFVLLTVAAFFMFSGSGGSPKKDLAQNNPGKTPGKTKGDKNFPGGNQGGKGNNKGKVEDPSDPGDGSSGLEPLPAVKGLPAATPAFTYLLPPSSQHVFHVFVEELLNSQMGTNPFLALTDAKESQAKKKLGFSPRSIDQVMHAENYTYGWHFNAIHTRQELKEDDIVKALDLQSEQPVDKQKYYRIPKGQPVLGQLASLSLTGKRGDRVVGKLSGNQEVYLRVHDRQTLIIADWIPMQDFLKNKGKFPHQIKDEKTNPKPGGNAPPTPNVGSATTPGEGGLREVMNPLSGYAQVKALGELSPLLTSSLVLEQPPVGKGGNDPKSPPKKDVEPPAKPPASDLAPPPLIDDDDRDESVPPYLTLSPKLRNGLYRVSFGRDPMLFCSVTDLSKDGQASSLDLFKNQVLWHLREIWDVTAALDQRDKRIQVLAVALRKQKKKNNYRFSNSMLCVDSTSAQALATDLLQRGAPAVADFFGDVFNHPVKITVDEPAKPAKPGDPGFKPQFDDGKFKFKDGKFGFPTGGDKMGDKKGGKNPPRPGPGKKPPDKGGKKPLEPSDDFPQSSEVRIGQEETTLDFSLYLVIPKAETEKFRAAASLVLMGLKQQLDVGVLPTDRLRLAQALPRLAEKGIPARDVSPGHLPYAAFKRSGPPIAREPSHRISWMAGLLPYLDHQSLYDSIRFDLSWQDPTNWLAARTLVPEFLDPAYGAARQWASSPGLPLDAAATHVVGIGGVGDNAADLSAEEALAAGKLGAFGYNRSIALQQIEQGRGLANTAIMIQVSPDTPAGMTPWIAGGGSTVRTIPTKNSIKPFVANHGGKQGTFVIMGDGSVRFINSNIPDKLFKQLCTVGPRPDDFDEQAIEEYAPRLEVPIADNAKEKK